MRTYHHLTGKKEERSGIALIIVMIVIVVLGILAGGFAYSMKVETKLAANSGSDGDLELLGRSGVELARYVLGQQLGIPQEGAYDALTQKWAGGPGGTNDDILADIDLDHNELGQGSFSVKIKDLERKFNINFANEEMLHQALQLVGADAASLSTVTDSIMDWIDRDNDARISGAETEDYLRLVPGHPYRAKNGPIDDISELLLVKGMTKELYWGFSANPGAPAADTSMASSMGLSSGSPVGLYDLFTSMSAGPVNVNTASAEVLQLIPGLDPGMAQAIISERSNLPFDNIGLLASVPGMSPDVVRAVSGRLGVRSVNFEVEVTARIGRAERKYVALIHRNNRQDLPIVYFRYK